MKSPTHILITGASSGLGRALALTYAANGIQLSLHGRDRERLAETAQMTIQRGAGVSMHVGDVTDAFDMEAWVKSTNNRSPIDLVIANAGISGGTARGETSSQVERIFAANVAGVFNTIHPVLPLMKQRRLGQIALISSLASFRGLPGAPAYCASKAAVRLYGEGLRGEMAPHNVQINVVCPGFIKTPMTDQNFFPMPFMMTADKASQIIKQRLQYNQARIAFPWPAYAGVRLFGTLPQPLIDFIAQRSPKK